MLNFDCYDIQDSENIFHSVFVGLRFDRISVLYVAKIRLLHAIQDSDLYDLNFSTIINRNVRLCCLSGLVISFNLDF